MSTSDRFARPSPARARMRRAVSTSELGVLPLNRLAVYLSLMKDALEILWKVAPLMLFYPGVMLLLFLKQCDWPELFTESALSVPGLSYIFSVGLAFLGVMVLSLILPSVLTVGINFSSVKMPLLRETVMPMYVGAYLGWCLALLTSVVLDLPYYYLLAGPPLGASIFAVRLVLKSGRGANAKMPSIWTYIGRILEASVAVVLSSFGILALINLMPPSEGTNLARDLIYVVVWMFISGLGLAPGLNYLLARSKREGHIEPLKSAMLGVFFVTFVMLYGLAGFVPVSTKLLEEAGIFSDQKAYFQITGEQISPALKGAGFQVNALGDSEFVSGYARYSLGGVRLLCMDPLEQRRDPFANPAPNDAQRHSARLIAGSHCLRTSLTDLRRFTSSAEIAVPVQ